MSDKNSNIKLTAEQIEAELKRVRGAGKLAKKTDVKLTKEQIQAELKRARGIKEPKLSKKSKKKAERTISKPKKKDEKKGTIASGTTDVKTKTESPEKTAEASKAPASPMSQKEIDEMLMAEKQRQIDEMFSAAQIEVELKRVKHKVEFGRLFRDTIIALIGVAAVAVLISVLFLPVLKVTGSSMEKTLYGNDIVICKKTSEFEKGEIIAFYFNNRILLKRVIGQSGDIIDISEDGYVTVNGVQLDEPYVNNRSAGNETDIEFPYQVPDKRVFVLGDNRLTSIDSRSSTIGSVADEYILGKVIFRVWPMERIGIIK